MRRLFKFPKIAFILAFVLLPLIALGGCEQFGAIPRGEFLDIVKPPHNMMVIGQCSSTDGLIF